MNYDAMYIRHGVRCYNGAYDSKTVACFDAQEKCLAEIRAKEPNAKTIYYPAEAVYGMYTSEDYRQLTDGHSSRAAALEAVHRKLYQQEN